MSLELITAMGEVGIQVMSELCQRVWLIRNVSLTGRRYGDSKCHTMPA